MTLQFILRIYELTLFPKFDKHENNVTVIKPWLKADCSKGDINRKQKCLFQIKAIFIYNSDLSKNNRGQRKLTSNREKADISECSEKLGDWDGTGQLTVAVSFFNTGNGWSLSLFTYTQVSLTQGRLVEIINPCTLANIKHFSVFYTTPAVCK